MGIALEVFASMQKNKTNVCILGGSDNVVKAIYNDCKKNFNKVVYINFSRKKINNKSHKGNYNLKVYELKKCLNILKNENIDKILFLGKILRPNLKDFKLDGAVDKYLPDIMKSYTKGDGSILNLIISIFKNEGFKIISIFDASDNFTLNSSFKRIIHNKNNSDRKDFKKSVMILNSISKYDNAQSVVVSKGYILAIEAAEGTDEMLKRVYRIKKELGLLKKKEGIFVKIPKKDQNVKIDMPVIGPKTIDLIFKSKLSALAINRKNTLIYDLDRTIQKIMEKKINLYLL